MTGGNRSVGMILELVSCKFEKRSFMGNLYADFTICLHRNVGTTRDLGFKRSSQMRYV